jgi:carbon-monoxide dehydrogenase small subunit
MRQLITLNVNGEDREVAVEVHHTLLEVLREELELTGTKHGCELGECGTCAVLVDGEPILSCLALPIEMVGRKIVTVEGLAERGRLHPLQVAFAELGAAQCGYCTPGILVTAKALLDHNLSPTRQEIREALAGNLCRCTGYTKILDSVELAARRMRDASPDLHPPAPGPRVGALVEVEDPAPQPGAAALGMPR